MTRANSPSVKKTELNVPPAARNFVDNSRMPYGDKKQTLEFLDETPVFSNEIVTESQGVTPLVDSQTSKNLDLDIWASTNRKGEPVQRGMTSVSPVDTTQELIYELYALTGDPALARLIR
tara:strand:- start:290 stop:649 length:360 start_codon:yes stop_codon:yes gene_type:complete